MSIQKKNFSSFITHLACKCIIYHVRTISECYMAWRSLFTSKRLFRLSEIWTEKQIRYKNAHGKINMNIMCTFFCKVFFHGCSYVAIINNNLYGDEMWMWWEYFSKFLTFGLLASHDETDREEQFYWHFSSLNILWAMNHVYLPDEIFHLFKTREKNVSIFSSHHFRLLFDPHTTQHVHYINMMYKYVRHIACWLTDFSQ